MLRRQLAQNPFPDADAGNEECIQLRVLGKAEENDGGDAHYFGAITPDAEDAHTRGNITPQDFPGAVTEQADVDGWNAAESWAGRYASQRFGITPTEYNWVSR
jgi:hypothetical protein